MSDVHEGQLSEEPDAGLLAAVESGIAVADGQNKFATPDPDPDPDKKPAADPDAKPEPEPDPDPDKKPDPDPDKKPESEPDKDQPAGDQEGDEPPAGDSPSAGDEKPPDSPVDPDKLDTKPSDEFGELHEDVKEDTRERFGVLKSKYDDLFEENESTQEQAMRWTQTVNDTGTNPEQFAMALAYLTHVNAGTREGLEHAWKYMQSELNVLGKALGKEVPGYDPLSEHEDLKERVNDGFIEHKDALEIAEARAGAKFDENRRAAAGVQGNQQIATDKAVNDIADLGKRLQQSDPNFAAKAGLLKSTVTAIVKSGAPPENWLASIESAYKDLPAAFAATKIPEAKKDDPPDSLRPGASPGKTGDQEKTPGSTLEAVQQTLSRM